MKPHDSIYAESCGSPHTHPAWQIIITGMTCSSHDLAKKLTTVDREFFVLNKFRKLNFRIINFRK